MPGACCTAPGRRPLSPSPLLLDSLLVAHAAPLPLPRGCSQGVQLSYDQVKRLLLSTVDPSPGKGATATITGGRLNIGAAMQALSLLLQQQGQPALPGMALEAAAQDDLRRTMLQNEWGQELLQAGGDGSEDDPDVESSSLSATEEQEQQQQEPDEEQAEEAEPLSEASRAEGRRRLKDRLFPPAG